MLPLQKRFQALSNMGLGEHVLYSFIPATIMAIFNAMLIITTLMSAKTETSREFQKANAKKRKLTISLLAITFAFIVLTLPSTIAWGYMPWVRLLPWGRLTLQILDYAAFLNYASVFINCLMCNYKFRSAVKMCVKQMLGIKVNVSRGAQLHLLLNKLKTASF